jgi:hypothetical protein
MLKSLLVTIPVALLLVGCGKPFTPGPQAQACEFIKVGEEAQYTRAYSAFTRDGAVLAFATNKGLVSEKDAALILVKKAEWPVGAKERAEACWK